MAEVQRAMIQQMARVSIQRGSSKGRKGYAPARARARTAAISRGTSFACICAPITSPASSSKPSTCASASCRELGTNNSLMKIGRGTVEPLGVMLYVRWSSFSDSEWADSRDRRERCRASAAVYLRSRTPRPFSTPSTTRRPYRRTSHTGPRLARPGPPFAPH